MTDRPGQTAIPSIYMCGPETTAWEVSVMPPDTAIALVIRAPWKETTAPKAILRCGRAFGGARGQAGGAFRIMAVKMHDPKPALAADVRAADPVAAHTVNAISADPVAAVRAIDAGPWGGLCAGSGGKRSVDPLLYRSPQPRRRNRNLPARRTNRLARQDRGEPGRVVSVGRADG